MKYLLLVAFCIACTTLMLSHSRPDRVANSGPPSPALLDAMSSHGIEVGTAAEVVADAPAPAEAEVATNAEVPQMQPAVFSEPTPVMQTAAYHPGRR